MAYIDPNPTREFGTDENPLTMTGAQVEALCEIYAAAEGMFGKDELAIVGTTIHPYSGAMTLDAPGRQTVLMLDRNGKVTYAAEGAAQALAEMVRKPWE